MILKISLLSFFILVSARSFAETAVAPVMAEKLANEFEMTKIKLMNDEVKQREILWTLYDINRKMKKIMTEKALLEQNKMVVEGNVKKKTKKIMTFQRN